MKPAPIRPGDDLRLAFGLNEIELLSDQETLEFVFCDGLALMFIEQIPPEARYVQITLQPSIAKAIGHILDIGLDVSLEDLLLPIEEPEHDSSQPDLRRPGDGTTEPSG